MENTKEKVIYANSFSTSGSIVESRLEFIVETPNESGVMEKEVVADIRVSPQLAKMITEILSKSLDAYEKQMGSLPVAKIAQLEVADHV